MAILFTSSNTALATSINPKVTWTPVSTTANPLSFSDAVPFINHSLLKMDPSGSDGRNGSQLYLKAQLFKTTYRTAFHRLTVTLVEVIGSQVLVGLSAGDQVKASHQQAVAYRNSSPLFASPGRQTTILSLKVLGFGVRGAMCGFDERTP